MEMNFKTNLSQFSQYLSGLFDLGQSHVPIVLADEILGNTEESAYPVGLVLGNLSKLVLNDELVDIVEGGGCFGDECGHESNSGIGLLLELKQNLASSLDLLQSLIPLFFVLVVFSDSFEGIGPLGLVSGCFDDLLLYNIILDLCEGRFDVRAELGDHGELSVGFLAIELIN